MGISKKLIILFVLSIFFNVFIPNWSWAAEIVKVQGKKVVISDPNSELELQNTYEFRDAGQKIRGKVKILKRDTKTKRVLGMVVQGKAQKKYTVEVLEDFDFTKGKVSESFAVQKGGGLRGYGGMFMGTDFSSDPFVFGGDFTWHLMEKIKLLVGGHYWFANEEYTNVELIEVNFGAVYAHAFSPNLSLEIGSRFGLSMLKSTFNIGGKLVDETESSLTISPLATVLYQFSSNWVVLAEVRKPIFLKDNVSADGLYAIAGLEFLW